MEDLTAYETDLALALVELRGRGEAERDCLLCRMPYPYCHCDESEEPYRGSSLLSVWEMIA